MNITTKTLSGAEISVAIGGQNTEIRNDGAATVYASANAGVVAGADGVVAIPAGTAVTVLDTRGRVYLLGTGEVSVVGKDTVSAVFKCAPTAGGSGQDDVARQAIAAHEGNAVVHVTDTEKAEWNAKFNYIGTVSDLFTVEQTCVCGYKGDTLNTPYAAGLTGAAIGLCVVNYEASAEYVTYLAIPSGTTDCYTAVSKNGAIRPGWDWRKLGGNADTINNKEVFYNSFSDPGQFGASLSSSANEIWQAMPNQSIFIVDCNKLSGDGWNFPVDISLYTLSITKNWQMRPAGIYLYPKTNGAIYYGKIDDVGNFAGIWSNIADGGNAASVGAYTESAIAALEARIAALENGGTT